MDIPESVTTIGEGAFAACSNLKEFTGKYAADGGRCLIIDNTIIAYANASGTTYNIPDSVTTIGYWAFIGCDSLTSVTIGGSVTTIGEGAFAGCSNLREFTGKYAADGGRCLIIDNTIIAYAEASGTTYNIPESVTTIGDWAFAWCISLTSVNIPDSVTTIGDDAFLGCGSLTSVNIPENVTTIGNSAFFSCDSLTSVNIPENVTIIGNQAFDYCTSLKYVYCKATTPPALGYSNVFDNNASRRRIIVPIGSGEAYKTAENWSGYANDIFEDVF